MSLDPVLPEHLMLIWSKIEEYVNSALEYSDGKFKSQDILKGCLAGDLLAWVVYNNKQIKGCFITELVQYPQSRRLNIMLLGGDDFKLIISHLDRFKEWARANNADAIECSGRPGWERKLGGFGFNKIHTLLRLDL
tara:strand:+ start:28039 stop:28446 length:408 start_codon:yes stop_codon:yes gene_type:complete